MRYFLLLLLTGILLSFGCSDKNSITNPVQEKASKKTWMKLPAKSGLNVETQFSAGAWIAANKGGNVEISKEVNIQSYGNLLMVAKLTVPVNAFHNSDSLYFTVILDNETCTATFTPSPYTFDTELEFDLQYVGLDLTGVDPDSVSFAYLAEDGEIVNAPYDQLIVLPEQGKIKVKNAKIPHFSRYGFVR